MLMGLNDVKISILTNLKLFNRLLKQKWLFGNVINYPHCVKIVQIRSFFWSVFSRIRTEYGEILHISLYPVRMRENTDQKKLRIWTIFTQCGNRIEVGWMDVNCTGSCFLKLIVCNLTFN